MVRLERERDDLLDRLTKLEHHMPEELARLERERDEAYAEVQRIQHFATVNGVADLERERDQWRTAHDMQLRLLGDTIKQRNESREQRDRLAEALNDLWHHYSLTDAAYALIDAALTSVEGGGKHAKDADLD